MQSSFPFYDQLSTQQRIRLQQATQRRHFTKDSILKGADDCTGLLFVLNGHLRVYTLSQEGREITLYRLLQQDMCLFSASCAFRGVQISLCVSAQQDTDVLLINPDIYKEFMHQNLAVANYTNELMAQRFAEVMWLLEQILDKKMDQRLAALLLEESRINNTAILHITHDKLAAHLGTAREVVSRLLKYFKAEGFVRLTRSTIEITDFNQLEKIQE